MDWTTQYTAEWLASRPEALIPMVVESTNRGERAYKTYCHHCHGENGDGTGHIGKGLVIKPVDLTIPDGAARFTAQNIAHVVREGSGKPGAAMIPWKTVLPEEAIKDVAVYTADLAARGRAKRLAK